jgi:hypothetical protein
VVHGADAEPDRGVMLLIFASAILGVGFVAGCVAYAPTFEARSDRLWEWARTAVVLGVVIGAAVAVGGAVLHFT